MVTSTTERNFGRLLQFNPESRNYQIRTILEQDQIYSPRSYTWRPGPQLDQGNSGRCVGYGSAGILGGRPITLPVTSETADLLYFLACQFDVWPGNNSISEIHFGTSVVAVLDALRRLSLIREFRWAGAGSGRATEDFLLALGYKGAVLVGTNWYNSMNNVQPDGHILVNPASGLAGGHCYYFYRVQVAWIGGSKPDNATFAHVDWDRTKLWIMNSWGGQVNGWMTLREVDHLIHAKGEAAVAIQQTRTS